MPIKQRYKVTIWKKLRTLRELPALTAPSWPPLEHPPTLPTAHTNTILGRVNGYGCLGNLIKISPAIESIVVTTGDNFTRKLQT